MKVLHICADEAKASGVHTFCVELDAALRKLGVDSRIVTQITTERDSEEVLAWDLDVVHIHGLWLKPLHQAAIWARKNGFPIVWSTHGMTAPWSMRHKWWKKFPAWLLYQRNDLRRAALIHSTNALEESWNRKLGLKHQIIIPLGTQLTNLAAGGEGVSAQGLGVGAKGKVLGAGGWLKVLFVGRIYPVKGLMNVVRATAHLKGENIVFRMVGPDEAGHLAELKREVEKLGVGEMFEWVGPKFGDELSKEYDECDILILPSFTENFGATVVDAMAHGKPALTSTFTGWKILEARKCGWWVDNAPESLAGKFKEIVKMGKEELREMGKRGRELVEREYTWEVVAKKMEGVYETIA